VNVTIGTFNLNNLFSRYNFKGEIDAIQAADTTVESDLQYAFGPSDTFKIRSYQGTLVQAKDPKRTALIAQRIKTMDLDVLAVQEVEDIDTLRQFNREDLNGLYLYTVLIEGNDPRLIDVGVLSKLPIGAVTSWQHAVHPDDPHEPVFGRDLLEVEILTPTRSQRLMTLFNSHLKSHYVDFRDDPVAGEAANTQRRTHQTQVTAEVVKARMRPQSRFIVLGDMNDPPESPALQPLVAATGLSLMNALVAPEETRPATEETLSKAWTYRHKPSGQPPQHRLYDHIWLSPALAAKQSGAWIDRRVRLTGDGSDHDPAWIEVRL
jgi:endonuclease/exonuclease/phosphatase family metal-dependent hydrolase